jgi:hypothetical protein
MNQKCEAIGCAKQPSFGFPGERPRRCKAHLQEGMVRLFAFCLGACTIKLQVLTCAARVLGRCSEYQV